MFIINLISTLFGIIICYRFFDCFLKRKELSRKYIFFTYGFLTLVTMFMNLTVINNIVNLMLSLMTIIIISLLFKDTLPNKLLVCSLYAIFSILLETSIWFFINIIFNLDDIIIDEYNFFVYFGLIIFNLIRFILISYLKKHRERNLFFGSKYISINILIVPLLSIII